MALPSCLQCAAAPMNKHLLTLRPVFALCPLWSSYQGRHWVSERNEYISMLNRIPLFRFPMLAQAQLLSEMQTYMSVGFRKQWPRRSWSSCSHSTDASLLPAFLSTRSLVSGQWFWIVLCSLTGRLWNILSPHTAVLPLEHIKGVCGPENAIFCWNCS